MAPTAPEHLPPATPPDFALEASGGGPGVFRALSQSTLAPKLVTGAAATVPFIALTCIVVVLAVKAYPAVKVNGLHFVYGKLWFVGSEYGTPVKRDGTLVPAGANYGALPLIVGTLASSAIALLFAVPVSVGAALAIVEKLPRRLSNAAGMFLEVLAGIPSVVFGLWGILVLGPVLARDVYPIVGNHMPNVPVLNFFRGSSVGGEGLLTAGLVLGVMIIPIVAATTRDLLRSVPRLPKEGAAALGMTEFEVVRKVSLPWIRAGLIGASVLGLARALGETIAVAMVCGAILGSFPTSIFSNTNTIAATIVTQLDGALTDGTGFAVRTLAELALVLAVITLLTNIAARLFVRKVAGTALPVGRGM
jgi:phosphate transport system permease protein